MDMVMVFESWSWRYGVWLALASGVFFDIEGFEISMGFSVSCCEITY